MKIDFTKPVQTRDGRKVRILCTDAGEPFPIVGICEDLTSGRFAQRWTADGYYLDNGKQDRVDLIQAPVKRTVWINIYKDGAYMYESKYDADMNCEPTRIACVKVEFEEGEGL
jgi:hypothetical protein